MLYRYRQMLYTWNSNANVHACRLNDRKIRKATRIARVTPCYDQLNFSDI